MSSQPGERAEGGGIAMFEHQYYDHCNQVNGKRAGQHQLCMQRIVFEARLGKDVGDHDEADSPRDEQIGDDAIDEGIGRVGRQAISALAQSPRY